MSDSTAFVFAGGGSLGAVQVGMLEALLSNEVVPDLVVGSSVGAINAAYLASTPNREGVAGLARIWSGLQRRDVFPISPGRALLGLFRGRGHLVDPRALSRLLYRSLSYARLEEAAIPCRVVATRLIDGDEVVLSEGPVVPALLASAAIPGVFPPVRIAGRDLIDGGVASNTPIPAAVAQGASRIVVLPTGSPCALRQPPRGALSEAIHALNLLIVRQLVRDAEIYAGGTRLCIVPPVCPLASSAYDFSHSRDLMQRAREHTLAWIAAGGLGETGIPAALRPHVHGA